MNDQISLYRRRSQNRVAQRKFRARKKAQRQVACCGRPEEVVMSDNNSKTMDQSSSEFHALNDIPHDMSIQELTNEDHHQSNVSRTNIYLENSLRQLFESTHLHAQESLPLNNQLLSLDQVRGDSSFNISGSLNDLNQVEQTKQDCQGTLRKSRTYIEKQSPDNLEVNQATAVVRSQRQRICDQAAEQLEKTISLYDFGVSLGILVADSYLRELLVNASASFHSRRFVDISDNTEQSYWGQDQ